MAQRFRNHPKNRKKALQAGKKLKTIAGWMERKLTSEKKEKYSSSLDIYNKILRQKKSNTEKIYSIHEPKVYCISKGKEHKKYKFGSTASLVITKKSGIIVGAQSLEKNEYNGHRLPKVLDQCEQLRESRPTVAIAYRGYQGSSRIGDFLFDLFANSFQGIIWLCSK
ncbi:hypothetical protein C0389_09290 [bacterium]|nr:hypothetical protein [bacterium]